MKVNKAFNKWLNIQDSKIVDKLKNLNNEEVDSLFSGSLEFGTAGLRGIMGLGTNRLNEVTICKLANAILAYFNQKKYKKIVIGFDTRNNSKLFSRVFAKVLANGGIAVQLFKNYVPTPVLIYSIHSTKSDMGIMITASHNMKEYNGVKVSNASGIQVSGDEEKKLGRLFAKIDEVEAYNEYIKIKNKTFKNINYVKNKIKSEFLGQNYKNKINGNLNIIYSPLNGTAYKYVSSILKANGFKKLITPANQKVASGEFKTCPYPNPEFEETFRESLKKTDMFDADVLIATDPDGDRLGVMIKSTRGYKLLTGNEVGFLLLSYLHENKIEKKNEYAISTVVSSPMFFKMCDQYGIKYKKSLTGFKNIGRAKLDFEAKYGRDGFVIGYEESCGYIVKDSFYDKDGIFTALKFCEMASYLKNSGSSVEEYLNEIYTKFGNIYSLNSSIKFDGNDAFKNMNDFVEKIRARGIKTLLKQKITNHIDYLYDETGLDKSNFIEYETANFNFIIRPSGTEPKLKLYIHTKAKTLEESKKLSQQVLTAIKKEIFGIND